MAGTVEFFESECPLGDAVDSTWELQNEGGTSKTATRAAETGRDGDELLAKYHDAKTTCSWTFICRQTPGESLVWPKAGKVKDGWSIDGFSCSWDRAQPQPKLTVNAHRHEGGNAHGSQNNPQGRTYTLDLDVKAQEFGVPAVFGTAFALTPEAVVDTRSATLNFSVSHIDELGSTGEELRGENHDGVATLQVDLTGAVDDADYKTDWGVGTRSKTPSNTGATASSVNLEKHFAHDAAA